MTLDKCSWKLVNPKEFVLGQEADRCGEVAVVKILRPNRKTDLFLCEDHINAFIRHWGLHNDVELLCHNYMEQFNQDPPAVPLVADPALLTDFITSGSKVPKKKQPQCHCPETHAFPDDRCMKSRGYW